MAELTQEEFQRLVADVLEAIRENSRTIPELTPITELQAEDRFEVSAGRNIPYSSLKTNLYKIFGGLTEREIAEVFQQLKGRAFLSRKNDDTAEGVIDFLAGFLVGDYVSGQSGACISRDGYAELAELLVRGESVFKGMLSSPDFVRGFIGGIGWAITEKDGKYTFEVDNLVVRNTMRIYEMIMSQLIGENDNRVFTSSLKVDHYDPETGTIWLDTQGGTFLNPFRKDDYIEVQKYNGMPSEQNSGYITKSYEFIVTETGIGDMSLGEDRLDWLRFKEFKSEQGTPDTLIAKGDSLARMDNDTDSTRKGVITITTVGEDTPYIDILHGMKTDPVGSLKGRLGNLQGLRHHLFGWLQGFGAYLTNLYAVGDFRLARTGDSLDVMVEILKDRFSSQYNEIRYEITEEDNYLYNPSFTKNLDGWETINNDVTFIKYPDGSAMLINGGLLLQDGSRATLTTYEGRRMLYIYNAGIRQLNSRIRKPDTRKRYLYGEGTATGWDDDVENRLENGSVEEKDILYLSIKFKAVTSGNLTIGFQGSRTEADSLPNPATVYVEASEEWQTMQWEGTWDRLGHFVLEYTGEMYVQQLALTSNPLEDFRKEIGTRIEQTTENIRLLAHNIDQKTGRMTQLGLDIDALDERITLYVETVDERLGVIEGTQLTMTSQIAELIAYKESTKWIGDELIEFKQAAGIRVMSESVRLFARQDTVDGLTSRMASLEVTIDGISARVEEVEDGVAMNSSAIIQTASEIRSEVRNEVEGLQSQITQNANEIELRVEKNGIISAINMSEETIKIQANKVEITGNLTINDIFQVTEEGYIIFDGVVKNKARYGTDIFGNNIVCLPPTTSSYAAVSMATRENSVGQKITLFNSTPLSQNGCYVVWDTIFTPGNFSREDVRPNYIGPQESMEFTCFAYADGKALWKMTSHHKYQDFIDSNVGSSNRPVGRYPLCIAYGKLSFIPSVTDISVSISFFDGRSALSESFTVRRIERGKYEVNFPSGTFPDNYFIICQGLIDYASDNTEAPDAAVGINVIRKTNTQMVFHISDDATPNDATFDFMVFNTQNWTYKK